MKHLFKIITIIVILIVILLIIKIVFIDDYSHSNKLYPGLKPVDGMPQDFAWILTKGPDFEIYNAADINDSLTHVGLYIGLHPDYDNEAYDSVIVASLLGEKVNWYITKREDYYLATTLTAYQADSKYLELKLHFWIVSNSEIKISEKITSLESFQIKLIE